MRVNSADEEEEEDETPRETRENLTPAIADRR